MILLCLRVKVWGILRPGESHKTGFDLTHCHEKEMMTKDFEKALVTACITGLPNQ